MKYLNYLLPVSIFVLTGCAEQDLTDSIDTPQGNTVISAVMAEAQNDTRTCVDPDTYDGSGPLGLLWSPADSIGVFGKSGVHALFRNTNITSNSAKTDFTGDLPSGDSPRRAYYPYNAANDSRSLSDLLGSLPAIQEFDFSTGKISGDYKVGAPESGSNTRFVFQHIFSLAKIDIDASGTSLAGEHLEYVEISVASPSGTGRTLAGDFHFNALNLTFGNVSSPSDKIRMVWSDRPLLETGQSFTGFISMMPDIRKDDRITLTVATENRTATFTVTSKVDFEAGSVYRMPLTLGNFDSDEYGWTEKSHASLLSFGFDIASNNGKLLSRNVVNNGTSSSISTVSRLDATIDGDNVSLTVPYLYDFKLIPEFSTSDGAEVYVNGSLQTSGVSEVDFSRPVKYEVRSQSGSHFYDVEITNSGLPVVVINQSKSGDFSKEYVGGTNVGSINIGGKLANQFLDFMVRGKSTDWVSDDLVAVYNADGTVNVAPSAAGVRLRGNTTRKYPKKPLAIKFNKKQSVLGMPKHKRWILLANWLDHSMLRNATAFTIARAITSSVKNSGMPAGIPWNVNGTNVELVIDGTHVGNYLLCEQIKIDDNRLALQPNYEDCQKDGLPSAFENCGYLIECDGNYDETFKFKTSTRDIPFMLKDDVLPSEYLPRIQTKVNGIEKNLIAGDFASAYNDLDIYSVIDQWIIWELTSNREYIEPRSVYYFMDGDGKLCAGPVWDFDRATFQDPDAAGSMGSDRVKPWNSFLYEKADSDNPCMWYPLLFKDASFRAAVKERWNALYPTLQSIAGEIATLGEKNRKSYERNNAMWPTTVKARHAVDKSFSDWSGDETIEGYDNVTSNLIRCYTGKLNAMNSRINTEF